MTTKIEWCDESWNPVRTKGGGWHCTKISPGCDHCWAESINLRVGDKMPYDGRVGEYIISEKALHQVFHWKKPRRIFVQDMGDLGLIWESHPGIFNRVMSVVGQSLGQRSGHTFIFLTKRPELLFRAMWTFRGSLLMASADLEIGVTAENQEFANYRVTELLKFREIAPRARLFVSAEPLIERIDFEKWLGVVYSDTFPGPDGVEGLDGIILGGETGPKARAMDPWWARSIRNQCIISGTPFFFKGWGSKVPSISDSIGDEKASELPPLGVITGDFKRYLDGRMWEELPGGER